MKTRILLIITLFFWIVNYVMPQSFSEHHIISTGGLNYPLGVHACDIDNDGDNDVFATDYHGRKVLLYINLGNGEFDFPIIISTLKHPATITTSDIDNDGDLDVLWSTTDSWNVVLRENLGNGEFGLQTQLTVKNRGITDFQMSDINNDDFDDIVITTTEEKKLSILFNNHDNTFTDPVVLIENPEISSFQCIDIDKDQDVDILFCELGSGKTQWLENTDNGTFVNEHIIFDDSVGYKRSSVWSFDSDNDGYNDIVLGMNEDSLRLYLNNGNNGFDEFINIAGNIYSYKNIKSVDYDNDSDEDLIFLSGISERVNILDNINGAKFESNTTINLHISAPDYEFAYVNNDSLLDLVFTTQYGDYIGWLKNSTDMPFSNRYLISSQTPKITNVSYADVNNDNYADIAISQWGFEPAFFLNSGNGPLSEPCKAEMPHKSPDAFFYDDFNNDGYSDILSYSKPGYSDSVNFIFQINNHDLTFTIVESQNLPNKYSKLFMVDLNNDSVNEIIGITNEAIHLLTYNDDFNFSVSDSVSKPYVEEDSDYLFSDLNNDGLNDMLLANYQTDNIAILLGEGNFFSSYFDTISGDFQDLRKIITTDINGDNRSDIVFATNNKEGWLENHSDNNFVEHNFDFDGMLRGMYPIDVNNDNLHELIVPYNGKLFLFHDIHENTYNIEELDYAWVSGGFALDIDYDGDMDFVSFATSIRSECRWLENTFINSSVSYETTESPFIVYPNPATLNIQISSTINTTIDKITIYNQLGQKVLNTNNVSNKINVSNLESGLYILEIKSVNLRIRKKLIIQ